MMSKSENLFNEYLNEGKLMQLATSVNSQMWMCHVWYAYDPKAQTIYFTSNKTRKHSSDIQIQPIVSGGIVAIDLEGLGQKVRGVSFRGRAEETMKEDEVKNAYGVYSLKWPQVTQMFSADDILNGKTNMRMYKVTLTTAVLFDEVNFPDSPRQELNFD